MVQKRRPITIYRTARIDNQRSHVDCLFGNAVDEPGHTQPCYCGNPWTGCCWLVIGLRDLCIRNVGDAHLGYGPGHECPHDRFLADDAALDGFPNRQVVLVRACGMASLGGSPSCDPVFHRVLYLSVDATERVGDIFVGCQSNETQQSTAHRNSFADKKRDVSRGFWYRVRNARRAGNGGRVHWR